MFETIVALATPPLKSALAIIRLSGDDCFEIVSKIFTKDLTKINSRGIHFGYIVDNNNYVDQVVLLTYVAPHSFTGEDSVEIICHGSMVIANEIIKLIISKGARMATNGEFSSRAYLNKKIDLVQAEAINDIINATTIEAKDLAMHSLDGETSKIFLPIKTKIGELISHIEVNIDYPEYEDIEQISREETISICESIINDINNLINDGEKSKIVRDGINVAIIGKPNVGKSSLLNALLKEDKAIVTNIAGTTRDVVEGDFKLCGITLHLLDTAGYHESIDAIEQIGINKTIDAIKKADLIIYVLDETGIDEQLIEEINDKQIIYVHNKADLITNKIDGELYISALNNDFQPLLDKIIDLLGLDNIVVKPSFSNVRQLGILKNIVNYLKAAIEDAKNNLPIDIVSVNVLLAYNNSLDLLGEGNKNDLTDEIFSRFCVGK
ncbi:MAG: tRNA uridine-5-carboxymethylaminomethyl(34) synthesis GTPase MnmE [Bacillales bacterium]|nr:tRNA uridine-5-carboxymethylaminomethyl(34) synthesis GTPase MnmE [Bacillales bacterium]